MMLPPLAGRIASDLQSNCEDWVNPNAKSRELLGKGGTLSGGQVSGDLPCRGSRGVPLASPFPKRFVENALSKGDNMEGIILSITASLLLAGFTALLTYFGTRSKISLDLSAEYDKDLRTSR